MVFLLNTHYMSHMSKLNENNTIFFMTYISISNNVMLVNIHLNNYIILNPRINQTLNIK